MAQRPSEDQAGLGQGPHTCVTSMQVGDVAVVQGGQSSMQAHFWRVAELFVNGTQICSPSFI
jgi:hypothetical protein